MDRDSDDLGALERGELAPPPAAAVDDTWTRTALVAMEWARSLGLRRGNSQGPTSSALMPVVEAWAATTGRAAPDHRQLGRGLRLAGLTSRSSNNIRYFTLHRDDAARLWAMVRAAWAPAYAPGDPRGVRRAPKVRRRLRPRLEPLPFHAELKRLGKQARPLVDSYGRVWPSGVAAARALRGNRKALDNSRRALQRILEGGTASSEGLLQAIRNGVPWRGVWWRHLTPAEVASVPPGHLSGHPLPCYGWGLVCPKCGVHPTATE